MRLTPEEWVRQQFLHRLVDDYHYPAGRIGVEVAIAVGDAKKRCDAVVYDEQLQPLVLIECKAEHVAITQRTLDQAITYNRKLNVPYLFLHNGPETVVVRFKTPSSSPYKGGEPELVSTDEDYSHTPSLCREGRGGSSFSNFLTYIPQWSQL